MEGHKWFKDCVTDLANSARDMGVPELLDGLSYVLEVYANEVSATEDERSVLLDYLDAAKHF